MRNGVSHYALTRNLSSHCAFSLCSLRFHSKSPDCSGLRWTLEATPRIELGIKVLQTSALPLGYVAGMERKTRLELATPTLARWCSTTELFPQMATRRGLEPLTSAVTGRHSNQLNYRAVHPLRSATNVIIHRLLYLVNIF